MSDSEEISIRFCEILAIGAHFLNFYVWIFDEADAWKDMAKCKFIMKQFLRKGGIENASK